MSHRNRIALATAALLAALFLAAPSPSHAAVQPWSLPVAGAWERTWTWLAHLLPGAAPKKPGAVQEKEGGAINPNGGTTTTSPVPAGTQLDKDGMTNPNGVK
ncbi:MAG: hypothetical protein ACJ76N_29950 [Thermoanaerobaculia bacterium]